MSDVCLQTLNRVQSLAPRGCEVGGLPSTATSQHVDAAVGCGSTATFEINLAGGV